MFIDETRQIEPYVFDVKVGYDGDLAYGKDSFRGQPSWPVKLKKTLGSPADHFWQVGEPEELPFL